MPGTSVNGPIVVFHFGPGTSTVAEPLVLSSSHDNVVSLGPSRFSSKDLSANLKSAVAVRSPEPGLPLENAVALNSALAPPETPHRPVNNEIVFSVRVVFSETGQFSMPS